MFIRDQSIFSDLDFICTEKNLLVFFFFIYCFFFYFLRENLLFS